MLNLIDRWFEPVQASQNYQRQDYVLLVLLLAAGAWLRFWHLGNVGLHGDEDIMSLAARGIVAHGIPVLPSDLIYLRAPLHTYLLAGSTLLFGDTEWALRLPSATVGSFCGLFAFFFGKRFLDPKPNLAFVALVTFLPAMIEISQTARMYVFLVASLLVFGLLLFRWEQKSSSASLLLAILVLLLSVQFHQLAIFAAPLLLYPGLANRSPKQLLQGAIGLGVTVVLAELFGRLAHRGYPERSERLIVEAVEKATPLQFLLNEHLLLVLVVAIVVTVAVILLGSMGVERWKAGLAATLLLAIGAVSCALLHYHVGVIALLLGSIVWLRTGIASNWRLIVIGISIGLMAVLQFYLLLGTGEFPGRTIIGAFVGMPSIWPTLRFMEFSPVGAAILIASVGFAAFQVALGRRVPVHFLFFAMAVWAPLVAMGLFVWYPEVRYTIGPLPFFLLSTIAGLTYLIKGTELSTRVRRRPVASVAAGLLVVAAIINPAAAWQIAENSYDDHPDHKGAAEYIKSLKLGPADIIIAEDSIIQTYYLGMVNYRLQNTVNAKNHSVLRDGVLYGQYTGTPVIGSGRQFEAILSREPSGDIYIISSSQGSPKWKLDNRADGIAEILESDRLEVIYVGHDHETKVWKLR